MSGTNTSSAARRKRAERERRRKAGFVLRQIWVRPTDWPRVKRYLAALERPEGLASGAR
jgi:hypothetical protein